MSRRRLVAACALALLALVLAATVALVGSRGEEPGRLDIAVLPGGASLWQGPCGERGLVHSGGEAPTDLDSRVGEGDGTLAWTHGADEPGERFALCDGDEERLVRFEVAEGGCLKATHRRFVLATCGDPDQLGPVDVAVADGDAAWVERARPAVVVAGSAPADRVERWSAFAAVYPLEPAWAEAAGGEVTITTTGEQRFTVAGAGRPPRVHPIGRDGVGGAPRPSFNGDPSTTARIGWGFDEEAGLRVSEARFPDQTASHVVLAQTGEAAGSLIGAPLSREGPLLHVDPGRLSPAVRREIRRVLPEGGPVYVIGAASGDAVAAPLQEDGFTPVEFTGVNRVDVSIAVADELLRQHPGSEVALVAGWPAEDDPSGGWADVVAAVAWATASDVPVVLTRSDRLPEAVTEALERWQPERVWLFGDEDRLGPEVADAVPGAERIGEGDPAATAVRVVDELWEGSPDRYVVVDAFAGEGWLAVLAAAGLSADHGAPFLLTAESRVPAATRRQLATCDPPVEILLLGGRAHVTDEAERELEAARREAC